MEKIKVNLVVSVFHKRSILNIIQERVFKKSGRKIYNFEKSIELFPHQILSDTMVIKIDNFARVLKIVERRSLSEEFEGKDKITIILLTDLKIHKKNFKEFITEFEKDTSWKKNHPTIFNWHFYLPLKTKAYKF